MHHLYIDVGSSTVKIYSLKNGKLSLIAMKSFHFKDGFDPKFGLTDANKNKLYEYINGAATSYKKSLVKVYATAIFRRLDDEVKRAMVDEFYQRTGLFFNIVSHDLENYYLERALSNGYTQETPLLLINIGGGSTELVVIRDNIVIERHNLDIGVMTVLKDFPYLNEEHSKHELQQVVDSIVSKLPPTNYDTPHAVYNGGELTYMQLVGYPLEKSTILDDGEHPFHISRENFANKNQEIFHSLTLKKLEVLMPDDPIWMHGARACSAIAQAISLHFNVKQIVPSNSNMVHGIVKQELRSVVLSGSFRKHLEYILDTGITRLT